MSTIFLFPGPIKDLPLMQADRLSPTPFWRCFLTNEFYQPTRGPTKVKRGSKSNAFLDIFNREFP